MNAEHLRVNYMSDPVGIGDTAPEFFWNCSGGITQKAYRILCVRDGKTVWDSGKVPSSSMSHIKYSGETLGSRDRVDFSIQLWDEKDVSGEPAEGFFELGLLSKGEWKAQWISGDYAPKKKKRYPVDCFRKNFTVRKNTGIKKVRLYAAARGIYDVTVNGTRMEDFILAPGSTDYRIRSQVHTYVAAALLNKDNGENTIELRLADGWFRGSTAAYGVTNVYGTETSILAQLEILYEDGEKQLVCTDNSWAWSNDGQIRFADLKDGEIFDARFAASYNGKAKTVAAPAAALVCSDNVPVQEHERFKGKLLKAKDGMQVLDFGQNIAGYPEIVLRGKAGQRVRFVCGEILDADGHVDLSGIQETRPAKGWSQFSLIKKLVTNKVSGEIDPTPRQEIVITCSGKEDHYKTSFAVFGFRYMQVEPEGDTADLVIDLEKTAAVAVYSDLEQTGSFTCSNALVNRLLENTRWSMKGNFLDVPTDCPTRERLGWTGDAQIFFDAGAYLMNTAPFFRKWLRDMEDAQYKNGLIPAVLPYSGVEQMYKTTGSSVGWADAIYLIPYRYYKRFGDMSVLSMYWPMMKKYADYLMGHLGLANKKAARENPDNAFCYEKGMHLGEWLEPEEFRDKVYRASVKHPEECTAYLFYAMSTMAEIAQILGKTAEAEEMAKYAEGAKRAYLHFAELDTDRQAKLVRPLALGLLEGETRQKAQKRLKKAVENYRYRVGTGFLSTPFLLPVLTEAGEVETAYRMLLNEEKPGWLGEVLDGATTVWENWEGNCSQNHYSPGAVCQWLFDTCAGIRQDGENHFIISPVPGGELEYAGAEYLSLYGRVFSGWEKTKDGFRYTVEIPSNCTAEVLLPGGRKETIHTGKYQF